MSTTNYSSRFTWSCFFEKPDLEISWESIEQTVIHGTRVGWIVGDVLFAHPKREASRLILRNNKSVLRLDWSNTSDTLDASFLSNFIPGQQLKIALLDPKIDKAPTSALGDMQFILSFCRPPAVNFVLGKNKVADGKVCGVVPSQNGMLATYFLMQCIVNNLLFF